MDAHSIKYIRAIPCSTFDGCTAERTDSLIRTPHRRILTRWRGGWDSNPRRLSHLTRFRDEHIQPLCHLPRLSVAQKGGQTQYCATALLICGDPGAIRTPDLFLRREAL